MEKRIVKLRNFKSYSLFCGIVHINQIWNLEPLGRLAVRGTETCFIQITLNYEE